MSHVDSVLLSFSIMENSIEHDDGPERWSIMEPINRWLNDRCRQGFGPNLGDMGGVYGGYKYLETPLFLASFNGFPEDEFMEFLATLPWEHPESVQLITKRQHDDTFEILTPAFRPAPR